MTRPLSIRIPTGALDCSACARRLEIRLAKVPGVTQVRVGPDRAETLVELRSDDAVETVLLALKEGGFESGIVAVSLPVWHLELAEPVMRAAEARLLADGAVRRARFDPPSATLRVEYVSSGVDLDAIRRTLEPFGVRTGHPLGSAPGEAAAHAARGRKIGWTAGAFAGGAAAASLLSAFMPVAAAADPIMALDPLASAVRGLGLVSPSVAAILSLLLVLAGAALAGPMFRAAGRDLRNALPTPRLLGVLAAAALMLWSIIALTTPWWSGRTYPPMAGAALWSLAALHAAAALLARRGAAASPATAAAAVEDRGRALAHWMGLAGIALALLAGGLWLAARPRDSWIAVLSFSSILLATGSSAAALAAPFGLQALIDRLERRGIRLRSRAAASVAARTRTLVIDRRGGLTLARARVTAWILLDGTSQAELSSLAAAAQAGSPHPFARAIVERAPAGARPAAASSPAPGGVVSELSGETLLVGSAALLASRGIAVDRIAPEVAPLLDRGATPCYVALQGRLLGAIILEDPMRPSAAAAIAGLRSQGIATVLATADDETTARRDAVLAGTSSFAFELDSRSKAALVSETAESSTPVAWLSLPGEAAAARADLSIAWGEDTAAGDVALGDGEFTALPELFTAARAEETLRRGRIGSILAAQPLAWAIAGGALVPLLGLLPSPPLAALVPLAALALVTGRRER